MVIRDLLSWGAKTLKSTYSTAPQLDAAVLLCHVLGQNRSYLVTHADEQVSQSVERRYRGCIQKCAEGVPVAYLIGIREFMSLEFEVAPDVLIPRPDTETICEWVIERCKGKELYIADLCCGSGCIGISLAVYLQDCFVTMVDVCGGALEVAKRNAKRHGIYDRSFFVEADLLKSTVPGLFDVIVCNPPYIESAVIDTLQKGVSKYEPRLALDGGPDGLMFYRRLAQIAPGMLKQGGFLVVEVGDGQADKVCGLFEGKFDECRVILDISGAERVVAAAKN